MGVVRTVLAAAACSVVLGACADDAEDRPEPEETAVESPSGSTTPSPTGSPSPGESPTRSSVELAVADLAARLALAPDEVEVVSNEGVTWRNGSRGCAEPGTSYTQALVEGSRIVLRAGGRTWEYHAGGPQPPALCRRPTE